MATPPDFTAGQVLTAAQMNAVGMWLITSGTLSGVDENFQGCFNDDFRNYKIVISDVTMNATGDIYFRMMSGATPASGAADYRWAMRGLGTGGVGADSANAGASAGYTGMTNNGANGLVVNSCILDVYSPKLAVRTLVVNATSCYPSVFAHRHGMSVHNVTTAYNGFQFLTTTATTMTGEVRIYGYNF